jgi:hypothetical protein
MEVFPVFTLWEVSGAHNWAGFVEKRNFKTYVLDLKNTPPKILGTYDFRTENQI